MKKIEKIVIPVSSLPTRKRAGRPSQTHKDKKREQSKKACRTPKGHGKGELD